VTRAVNLHKLQQIAAIEMNISEWRNEIEEEISS